MKKIVISGSSKLPQKIEYWKKYFEEKEYEVIDYPEQIAADNFTEIYPEIFKKFYENIEKADTFFLMNEEKNGIHGYIGAAGTSELSYAVIQKLIHNQNIEIYILNKPDKTVTCYDEVMFWLNQGWVKIYQEK